MPSIFMRKCGKEILVSEEDYEEFSRLKWHVSGTSPHLYAVTWVRGRGHVAMHRLIVHAAKGMHVDHINGNTLDNRRQNLRLASGTQNQGNRRLAANNSTGFTGVSKCKESGRFYAAINSKPRRTYLGRFGTAEQAAKARDRAALAYFGEHARLNFPRAGS